jgi:hypothetical protein
MSPGLVGAVIVASGDLELTQRVERVEFYEQLLNKRQEW